MARSAGATAEDVFSGTVAFTIIRSGEAGSFELTFTVLVTVPTAGTWSVTARSIFSPGFRVYGVVRGAVVQSQLVVTALMIRGSSPVFRRTNVWVFADPLSTIPKSQTASLTESCGAARAANPRPKTPTTEATMAVLAYAVIAHPPLARRPVPPAAGVSEGYPTGLQRRCLQLHSPAGLALDVQGRSRYRRSACLRRSDGEA